MKKQRSLRSLRELRRLGGMLLGALLYAFGINMFIVPAEIYSGGVMGFCQVMRTLLVEIWQLVPASFDIAGVLYYLINIPLLIMAWVMLDRRFVIRTVICVTAVTIFLSVIPTYNLLGGDTITGCLIGGVIAGAGTGLTLWGGGTTGGLDVLSMILLKKRGHISIGKINMLVNFALYTCCLILFDVKIAIYSIVYSVFFSIAVDKMHFQNIIMEVIVITKQPVEQMEKEIFETMNRGVTHIEASGGYTGEEVNMLFIVVSKYELSQLRSIIHQHDPRAFVTVKEQADVYGNFVKRI